MTEGYKSVILFKAHCQEFTMKKILIASKNKGKIVEISAFLAKTGFEIATLNDFPNVPDVEETGKTFLENAELKARSYFDVTGLPCIADDGGIEIEALNGEPGVKSRRWLGYEMSDEALVAYTLGRLHGVPCKNRRARLVVELVFFDGRQTASANGWIAGHISEEVPEKIELGYPFRSIFVVSHFGKLYKDLTEAEHEAINHRRDALRRLVSLI
jgi:XTP/dITP diphosphohydrolase